MSISRHNTRPPNAFILPFVCFHPLACLLLTFVALCLLCARWPVRGLSSLDRTTPMKMVHDERELFSSFQRWSVHPEFSEVEVYKLSEALTSAQHDKKIVALVEQRNVERALPAFLGALQEVVDSIVVLDDASTDRSRIVLMENAQRGIPVELFINVTTPWKRQELRHRQILLFFGRQVGGTHFVLPDYDELFSANCAATGLLRASILDLAPGESLYIPWIEVWKSIDQHRVLPSDGDMNFLTRRQIIIFADDGAVSYDDRSTGSRSLSTSNLTATSNTSIHVLRCPRTLCPAPLRYNGPGSPLSRNTSVKYLPECRIIELRFLNLANVLVKSAWYEALGRISGVEDGVTSGKMLHAVFSNERKYEKDEVSVAVRHIESAWLRGYELMIKDSYSEVELWRVRDLLSWRQIYGKAFLTGLSAFSLLDVARLRHSVSPLPNSVTGVRNLGVPRNGMDRIFVLCVDLAQSHTGPGVPELLHLLRGTGVPIAVDDIDAALNLRNRVDERQALRPHREWRQKAMRLITSATANGNSTFAFWSVTEAIANRAEALLDLLTTDMTDLDVVVLVAGNGLKYRGGSSTELGSLLSTAFSKSSSPGRNIRVLSIRGEALGSLAGLSFVCERLLSGTAAFAQNQTCAERGAELLGFAEKYQRATMINHATRAARKLPVARLIFSLNVGRSGSKYLASVLDSTGISGLLSLHEVACDNHFCSGGGGLRMQDRKLGDSYEERRFVKIAMIRRAIASMLQSSGASVTSKSLARCRSEHMFPEAENGIVEVNYVSGCTTHSFHDLVYSETNPNFKSWIYDVVLDTLPHKGYAVDVVVLRKYIPASVRSLMKTGYFTSRDGYNWMETANGVNSLIRPIAPDLSLDAYDKMISYVVNAEAVTRHVMARYNESARFFEVRSETLYSKQGALDFVKALGLSPSLRTIRIAGTRIDKYEQQQQQQLNRDGSRRQHSVTLAVCERRVRSYLERCAAAGIELPPAMTHLQRVPGFEYA